MAEILSVWVGAQCLPQCCVPHSSSHAHAASPRKAGCRAPCGCSAQHTARTRACPKISDTHARPIQALALRPHAPRRKVDGKMVERKAVCGRCRQLRWHTHTSSSHPAALPRRCCWCRGRCHCPLLLVLPPPALCASRVHSSRLCAGAHSQAQRAGRLPGPQARAVAPRLRRRRPCAPPACAPV